MESWSAHWTQCSINETKYIVQWTFCKYSICILSQIGPLHVGYIETAEQVTKVII